MKLPQVKYKPVQSLGRNNLSAVGAEVAAVQQQGNAYQAAMGAVASASADYIERKENQEYNDQIAQFNIELADWQSRHNAKAFYTSEEIGDIPEDVVRRMDTMTDDNGHITTMDRASIPAYEVYPHLLKQKLEGMTKQKAELITNPRMRKAFVNRAQQEGANMLMTATLRAEEAQRQFNIEAGVNKATNAAERGDLATALFMVDNLEIDANKKAKLNKEMGKIAEFHDVTQAIRSTDLETVMAMKSLLDDENYEGYLTEAQRQGAIRDLDGRYDQLSEERITQQETDHRIYISDALVAIESGQYTLKDVERDHEAWKVNDRNPQAVSPEERIRLRNAINARNAALSKKTDLAGMGAWIIANGGDMTNSEDRRAVDAYVEANGIADLAELEKITFQASVMPTVLERWMNSAALHDAEQGGDRILPAVQMYGRFADSKPEMLSRLGTEAKNVLADAHFMTRAGVDAQTAYTLARENARIKPELRDNREAIYRAEKYKDTSRKALQAFMNEDTTLYGFEDTWYGKSSTTPTPEMEAEFQAASHMHYLRTGDIALSQRRAWGDMQEHWSPTEVGGKFYGGEMTHKARPMRYAPERVMAVSPAEANNRLKSFANAKGLDVKNIQVVSDDTTARTGTWAVYVYDPETDDLTFYPERWNGFEWAEQAAKETYDERKAAARAEIDERRRTAQEFYDFSYGAQIDDQLTAGGN